MPSCWPSGGSWSILGRMVPGKAFLNVADRDRSFATRHCGFDVNWTAFLRERHAGAPIKPVSMHWTSDTGEVIHRQGEFVLTRDGIEGSLVYALSAHLRDEITRHGSTTIHLDLLPGRDLARLTHDISRARGKHSLAKHLHRQRASTRQAALLHEVSNAMCSTIPNDWPRQSSPGPSFAAPASAR